jgi:hypothetical protein
LLFAWVVLSVAREDLGDLAHLGGIERSELERAGILLGLLDALEGRARNRALAATPDPGQRSLHLRALVADPPGIGARILLDLARELKRSALGK